MLLLVLPASTFKDIVPGFIVLALVLTLAQPTLNRRLAGHVASGARRVKLLLPVAIYATGVYGGYFGAGQGILLLAILGATLPQSLHDSNALKNVLPGLVNGVAGVYFMFAAHVEWGPAGIIAVVLDRRRAARRALRPAAAARRAARADRRRRGFGDRATAHGMSSPSHCRAPGSTAGGIE